MQLLGGRFSEAEIEWATEDVLNCYEEELLELKGAARKKFIESKLPEFLMTEGKLNFEHENQLKRHLHMYEFRYKMRTGRKPSGNLLKKQRAFLIKKLFSDDKTGLPQSEKENGQFKCLLNLLRDDRKHLSLEEMSEKLVNSGFKVGSSVKTIYRRILPELQDHGAVKDDEGKYYIPEYKRDPEHEEKIAEDMINRMGTLAIISSFLDTIKDSPFYEAANEFIEQEFKICRRRELLDSNRKYDEGSLVSRVIFMGAPVANIKTEIWDKLHGAMLGNELVQIRYLSDENSEPMKYTIQPYQLIYDNGFWEVWGNSLTVGHRGKKLFNLSRILDVQILETAEKFELPENYDFRSTLAGCFGCYNDNVAEDYSIKFKKDSYAYRYVKDRIWGEYQEITEVEDGYILEFEATQYLPILRWVLSWGSEVEPLEPQKLVDDWKEKICEMYKKL